MPPIEYHPGKRRKCTKTWVRLLILKSKAEMNSRNAGLYGKTKQESCIPEISAQLTYNFISSQLGGTQIFSNVMPRAQTIEERSQPRSTEFKNLCSFKDVETVKREARIREVIFQYISNQNIQRLQSTKEKKNKRNI